MNRRGVQKVGALFRELGSISELLAECEVDSAEPVIFPEAALSLIEQMRELTRERESKPVIRTIHHFACTGGTVISKCLSSLPNVFLLSEVHPFSSLEITDGAPVFSPSNLSKLARYASIPQCSELAERIYVNSVREILEHVEELGGTLVLRDHTHSDFCVGSIPSATSRTLDILNDHFEFRSIATVRDPIDSFASLRVNGWCHFEPNTFDEYCRRYQLFLENHRRDHVFRYEDFISDPQNVMESICKVMELTVDSGFVDVFSLFSVTGDSGRGAGELKMRERRALDDGMLKEIERSEQYKIFCKKYGY